MQSGNRVPRFLLLLALVPGVAAAGDDPAQAVALAIDDVTVIAASPVEVRIPDANLRAAVERELGKQAGETISSTEMEHMASLWCGRCNIKDLTGLQFATGLEDLMLGGNAITDAAPLSSMSATTT